MNDKDKIITLLESMSDPRAREGMQKFGIRSDNALGISIPVLREIAKHHKKEHDTALALWESPYHEAKILATMIADPGRVTPELMDRWCRDFDSWDTCDQCCSNLFRHTLFAFDKVYEYAEQEPEFVRRTAFSLIATLAVGDKISPDERFLPFFDLIVRHSQDGRNFVRKAVNWALRQIGKRNMRLHPYAVEVSKTLSQSSDATARWIGTDAYRELTDPKIIRRIKP